MAIALSRRRTRARRLLYQAIAFAVFASVWEFSANFSDALLIPTFTETLGALAELLTSAETYEALWLSNQALWLGFTAAAALGLPLGLALGRFKMLEPVADPYLSILLVTPMAAIIPLLIMSVGIGLLSRVIIVAVFVFPMIVVNARAGVRQVEPSLVEMGRSFGATEPQLWTRVLFPSALPAILTGVRLGIGRAFTGMVVVELLMVSVGIGSLVNEFRGHFKAGELYAIIVIVLLEAVIIISLVQQLEGRIVTWIPKHGLRGEI